MDSIAELIKQTGEKARSASNSLRIASTAQKNNALICIANQIQDSKQFILDANHIDLNAAKKNGIDDALLDRLMLNDERLNSVIQGLHQIATLNDPIGQISNLKERPSGITVSYTHLTLPTLLLV